MAETTYTYSISNDFPGGAVNVDKLASEIKASSIVTALTRIDTVADVIDIVFQDVLTSGDRTILDGDTTNPAGGLIGATDTSPTLVPLLHSISVFDAAGGQSFTGPTTISFDTLQKNTDSSLFAFSASQLTTNFIGTILVSYQVSISVAGNSRTSSRCWFERDGTEIVGTSSYGYHRNSSNGEDTAAASFTVDVSPGETFRVRTTRQGGTGTLTTVANGSHLTIIRLI